MKVGGYVRGSTNKQDLESQEFILKDWPNKNEHELTLFKDFAVSGKKEQRKGIDELLLKCRAHEFDAVAVVEISRFGRSIKIIYEIVEELTKLGKKIILANSNTILDYNTLEGKALIGGLSLASEIEWCLIQERNKRGREKIKRDKIKVGRKRSEDKDKNPLSLEAIKLLRDNGKSYRQIAKEFNTSAPTVMRMLKR